MRFKWPRGAAVVLGGACAAQASNGTLVLCFHTTGPRGTSSPQRHTTTSSSTGSRFGISRCTKASPSAHTPGAPPQLRQCIQRPFRADLTPRRKRRVATKHSQQREHVSRSCALKVHIAAESAYNANKTGEAIFFPPTMVHQTSALDGGCGLSASLQIRFPFATKYVRKFWERILYAQC